MMLTNSYYQRTCNNYFWILSVGPTKTDVNSKFSLFGYPNNNVLKGARLNYALF
jgi:hypothetical protein